MSQTNGLFTGSLNQNSVLSTLYNMIIDMTVLTDNFKGTDLYTKAVSNAGQYGDQVHFICSNPQSIQTWEGHEAESAKLLETNYNKEVKDEAVVIDQKFMSFTTTDEYESKKVFLGPGAFGAFVSLVKGFVSEAKNIHCALTYNAYVGTVTKTSDQAIRTITVTPVEGEDLSTTIAKELGKLIKRMNDYTTDYNSFGYLRRYSPEDIKVIFNSDYQVDAKYVNLPSIFHNEALKDIFTGFDDLNPRFFGDVNANATEGDGSTVRSLVEQDITVTGGTTVKHYKPGDLIDDDYVAPAGTSYTTDGDIIGKVFIKLPKYIMGWTASEEFHNARGLTNTQFLVWTESKPYALDAYPVITIKKASN